MAFGRKLLSDSARVDCILFGSVDTCFFVGTNNIVGVDVEVHLSKAS